MPIDDQARPSRVETPNDILIPDEDFCREVLGGCARRTAKRYEREGLPYILIRGRKYRPLQAGRTWLASRVQSHTPQRLRRAR